MRFRSNFVAKIRNLITPELAEQIGVVLELDPETVKKGAELAVPLLTTVLAKAASTREGAGRVLAMIEQSDATVLANLSSYVAAFRPGDSAAMLAPLFGAGQGAVFASLRRGVGIDLRPLTAMIAPMFLVVLGWSVRELRLDANGLADLLQGEARGLARSGSPAVALVRISLRAGEAQAAVRASFSDDEWALLKRGVAIAAAMVIISAPSGSIGRSLELRALVDSVGAHLAASASRGLVGALADEPMAEEVRASLDQALSSLGQSGDATVRADNLYCITLAARVAEKAGPSEALAYKAMLLGCAQTVAGAAREGGFLGLGGVLVNEAEQLTLAEISVAIQS